MNTVISLSSCRCACVSPTAADTRVSNRCGMGDAGVLQIRRRPQDVSSPSIVKSPSRVKESHAHAKQILSRLQRSLGLPNSSIVSAAHSVSSLDSCSHGPFEEEEEEEADDASLTVSCSSSFQEIKNADAHQQHQQLLLALNSISSISLSISRFDSMPNLVDFQEDCLQEEQEEQHVLVDTDHSDFSSFRSLQKLKKRESRWQSSTATTENKQDFMPNTPRRQNHNRPPHHRNTKTVISSSPVCVSSFGEYQSSLSISPLCDAAPLPPRRTSLTDEQRITRAASCNDTIPVRRAALLPVTPRQARRASWDTLPTPPLRRAEEVLLVELVEDSNH
jgi:hypothetical protein